LAVINGNLTLGLYVTNFNMFQGMGVVYSDMYLLLLRMQEVIPGLKRMTRMMNEPTDLLIRAQLSHHQHAQSDQLIAQLNSNANEYDDDMPVIDRLPIFVGGISFKYELDIGSHDMPSHSVLSKDFPDHKGINFHGQMNLSLGEFVQLIGPHGEGKTTLLKLLGEVLLPKLSKDILESDDTCFFVPPHLSVIYVSSQPLFFRASLLENLSIGVMENSPDGDPERVFKICTRLGLPETIAGLIESDLEENWLTLMSHTELVLLGLARAFIANPQLLCVERHWMQFNDVTTTTVLGLLRDQVDSRGIEQDPDKAHLRRPRTCIMTGPEKVKKLDNAVSDRVFHVSNADGIQEVMYR